MKIVFIVIYMCVTNYPQTQIHPAIIAFGTKEQACKDVEEFKNWCPLPVFKADVNWPNRGIVGAEEIKCK